MSKHDDRRTSPRLDAKVPVKLRPTEGTTPYMLSGESVNVSEGGLLFTLDKEFQPGTTIELSFTMPAAVTGGMPMKVRCTARVIRLDRDGVPEGKVAIAAQIERFETIVAES